MHQNGGERRASSFFVNCLPNSMKAASAKLAFSIIFFILASRVQLKWMVGAQAQKYECKTDADCESQCDAEGCKKNCLGLPSFCVNDQCACPFGPGHSAYKTLTNSTCTLDDDCSNLCPSDCNIRSCLKAKCQCGCQR